VERIAGECKEITPVKNLLHEKADIPKLKQLMKEINSEQIESPKQVTPGKTEQIVKQDIQKNIEKPVIMVNSQEIPEEKEEILNIVDKYLT